MQCSHTNSNSSNKPKFGIGSLYLYLIFVFLTQCSDIERPSPLSLLFFQGSPNYLGVATSDFGGGGRYNVVDIDNLVPLPGLTPIHSDARLRFFRDRVYVINRLNRDSIQIINPSLANLTEREYSMGGGANPQDILVLQNKAYVSLYNRDYLAVINPATGSEMKRIGLSEFSEPDSAGGVPDGLPEMDRLVSVDGRVFLTIQRLDRNNPEGFFPPTDRSFLLEIDPIADRVIGVHRFLGTNPFSKPQKMEIFGDPHLVFAVPGRLGFLSELDGGIEAFNLRTNRFRSSPLLTESVAGGDILDVQIQSEESGFASVLEQNFDKRIIHFNPRTGRIQQNLLSFPGTAGTNFSGLLLDRKKRLIIGVSNFNLPGIAVYETEPAIRRLPDIPLELTPTDLIELREN